MASEPDDTDHSHCSSCFLPSQCTHTSHCPIIPCINHCSFTYHKCKSLDHLTQICPNQIIECINKTNGCKLDMKRSELGVHLAKCPASIIECSSFKVRRLVNRAEKHNGLKWPCPIVAEFNNLAHIKLADCAKVQLTASDCINTKVDINKVLLDQDYASLRLFARMKPLRFSRLYGYLIGLDVGKDFGLQNNFGFLSSLLKCVRSKVFADVQTENCIVFNTEVGCFACRARIKKLEEDRFDKCKKLEDFYSVLKNVHGLEEFVEDGVYKRQAFLKIYEQVFPVPAKERRGLDKDQLDDKELNDKLIENNHEILKVIELNELRLNVTKEVPCHEFFDHSDKYKLKETSFTSYCDQLIRRDQFTDHYALFHNNLLPNSNDISLACPMAQYGCPFFTQKVDFLYTRTHPPANLVKSDITGSLAFRLDYPPQSMNNQVKFLMELPFDVLFEIFDRLDSLSLFCLSMTCKGLRSICERFLSLRGIVYPKWLKKKNEIPVDIRESFEERDYLENRWEIDRYARSFSRHIESPSEVRLARMSEFNEHVQKCPFKRVRELKDKFKIY